MFAAAPAGTSLLWRDPGPIESLDLKNGLGGAEGAPQAPFTFVKEEGGGTTPKLQVTDARGKNWSVKFGPEAKPETFGFRMAWAAGYLSEPTYFIREGTIASVGKLKRAASFVDKSGHFVDARFQLRDPAYKYLDGQHWAFDSDGVKGTRELAGLKLLIVLLSNWDVKPLNFGVFDINGQRMYGIDDWGATMGRSGEISFHSKWECPAYTEQSGSLIDSVEGGFVKLNYQGKSADQVSNNVRVDDVKWFVDRMGKLSDAQVRDALLASGANADDATCFTNAFRKRLNLLASAASGGTGTVTRTITKTTTTTVK